MSRESTEEGYVVQWAKERGITSLKLSGEGNRGKSDRLFLRRGVAAFVEMKRKGEKPEPLQLKFMRERIADGFPAAWFDNSTEALRWLKTVFPD